MKISYWILAVALMATAWSQALAKPSVGTITPVKHVEAAKVVHGKTARRHHKVRKARIAAKHAASGKVKVQKAKAAARHAASGKAVAALAVRHPVEAANRKAAEPKSAKGNSGRVKDAKGAKDAKKNGAASAASSEPRLAHKHSRDPFVSPIVRRVAGRMKCTGTGRQCLFVGDVQLQGVVECSSGFIAVVANGPHTYFLRDNDPLADGEVVRITRNAIIMRWRTRNAMGRPVEREVTKSLGGPPA